MFVDADDTGNSTAFMDNLDNNDYVSWTNTRIEIELPFSAFQDDRVIGQRLFITPGSGRFSVRNDWGKSRTSSNAQRLNVSYATRQRRTSTGTVKRQVLIPNRFCYDGLIFRLGQRLSTDAQAVAVIERAMADWSSELGITVALEKDVNGDMITVANPTAGSDNQNVIFYSNRNNFMATSDGSQRCSQDVSEGLSDTDITINEFPANGSWAYNITGSISGLPFYDAILHEIGHALGLGHSKNQGDLMNPTLDLNPSSNQRKNLNMPNTNAKDGVLDLVARSVNFNFSCPSIFLTLNSGSSCSTIWNGSNWSNGIPHLGSNAVIDGTYNTASNGAGSFVANKLTVNSGRRLEIEPSDFVEIEGDVVNNGNIVGESGSSLIIQGNASSGGIYSFTRRTTHSNTVGSYSLIGSSVTNSPFSVLGGSAQNFTFYYDETNPTLAAPGNFIRPANAGQATMLSGVGYFSAFSGDINGDVVFTGTPNTGDFTIPITRSNHSASNPAEAGLEGYNLLSNPYTSPINAIDFINHNLPSIENNIRIWDDGNTNDGATRDGSYIVVTNNNVVTGGSGRAGDWDGSIRSMQGFFVRATTNGSAEFTRNMQQRSSNSDQGFFRTANDNNDQFEIKLTLSNEDYYDEALVLLNAGSSDDHDPNYDVHKNFILPNGYSPKLNIYSINKDSKYCIQSVSEFTDFKIIPLGMEVDSDGEYQLEIAFKGEGINGFVPYLIDNFSDQKYDVNDVIHFNSKSGDHKERFSLILLPESENDLDGLTSEMTANITDNRLLIRLNEKNEGNKGGAVKVYDFNGRIVEQYNNVDLSDGLWRANFNSKGIYVVVSEFNGRYYISRTVAK